MEKKINLVYESWDNNGYIINGMSLFSQFHFFDPIGLFESYLINKNGRKDYSDRRLSVKVCNLDDVRNNPNEKFFCVVSSAMLTTKMIFDNNWNFFLLDSTIEMIKEFDNLFFVVTTEHESLTDHDIATSKKLCIMKGIPLHKFYYINNNSLSDLLSEKYEINVKKINFIDFSSTEALSEIDNVEFVENKIGKFFMSRNKGGKHHRSALLFHLWDSEVINDVNYSKLFTIWEGDTQPYLVSLTEDEILEKIDLIKEFNGLFKEDDFEQGKGFYDHKNDFFTSHYENTRSKLHYPELKECYENSYINIVTESAFNFDYHTNVVHITEKSFRPFFYYQIPLILATPNHIKKMKDKYDFDFFDDIIDHSYDSETHDKIRFSMFTEEINRIYKNKDNIKEFYKKNRDRFELNKKKLMEIALDKTEDFDLFWNLI
jgi:hypothetical protein